MYCVGMRKLGSMCAVCSCLTNAQFWRVKDDQYIEGICMPPEMFFYGMPNQGPNFRWEILMTRETNTAHAGLIQALWTASFRFALSHTGVCVCCSVGDCLELLVFPVKGTAICAFRH